MYPNCYVTVKVHRGRRAVRRVTGGRADMFVITQPLRRRGAMGETALVRIGLLHPGEMGAEIGAALRTHADEVVWASSGRSGVTAERAERAGLVDAGDVEELCRRCEVLISVCPPHAAV